MQDYSTKHSLRLIKRMYLILRKGLLQIVGSLSRLSLIQLRISGIIRLTR